MLLDLQPLLVEEPSARPPAPAAPPPRGVVIAPSQRRPRRLHVERELESSWRVFGRTGAETLASWRVGMTLSELREELEILYLVTDDELFIFELDDLED